ncbi:MAG: alpha-L-rhamnosidase [Roseiflexaceae bacterium]|nr:alpha-L-rhamnosidase [Roseiflexaceae bacterium]
MRTIIADDPFAHRLHAEDWTRRGTWPAHWVAPHEAMPTPWVAAFKLPFTLAVARTLRLHVSADERYELWLDGARLGRGPERGDGRPWFFETHDLQLDPGEHTLVAVVWALGELAPHAQHSLHPGLLLCPQDDADLAMFATGSAPWQVKLLGGYRFTHPLAGFGVGHNIELDLAKLDHGFAHGAGVGWLPPRVLHPGFSAASYNQVLPHQQLLAPALLPAMLEEPRQIGVVRHLSAPALGETHSLPLFAADHLGAEAGAWQALLDGGAALELPANTRRRVIIDLGDYYCAYPELIVSGGEAGSLRLNWQESLFADTSWNKGNRNEIEGKLFTTMWWNRDGIGDRWLLGGGQRRLSTLWWQAGRYLELLVESSNKPLTIERITFRETRYPLENEAQFAASDPRLAQVVPLAVRALQMCAHETYMDCPYFEQLMYIGDTRIECLLTYTISADDRLPRKAMRCFDASRMANGLTQSRYPSRERQIIPPFSLWYVAMLHDYLMYRGDEAFVRTLLPGARGVLDHFTMLRGEDGLVRSPVGWNYVDWVETWPGGEAPGAMPGQVCAPINWQYIYSSRRQAEVEALCGEHELAARFRRLADSATAAMVTKFWDEARGLYADDAAHTIFTEHSQCLAVLSGGIAPEQRTLIAANLFRPDSGLTQPTVYFMHYFFETCRELGRMDMFLERMQIWFRQVELGFKTTYENGDPTTNRSDCHAWGGHPLFHFHSSLLGVRPAAPGFAEVEVRPQLAGMTHAAGRMPHPQGEIACDVWAEHGRLRGCVTLPEGVSGTLYANGGTLALVGGQNTF